MWTEILVAFFSGITLPEAIRMIRYHKSSKNKEESSTMDMTADTLQKYSALINTATDQVKELTEGHIALSTSVLNLQMQVNKQDFSLRSNERKIKGLQTIVRQEVGKKRYAEEHFCSLVKCELREPARGTFKSENPDPDYDMQDSNPTPKNTNI